MTITYFDPSLAESLPGGATRLDVKFAEFHAANKHIYRWFVKFAKQAIDAGYERLGAHFIIERIRWQLTVETRDAEGFKINNNWGAFYARMFMRDYPDYADFFATRESLADYCKLPEAA